MPRFWSGRRNGPIARAFSAGSIHPTPQHPTRRLGEYERTLCFNDVSFQSEAYAQRLLSIDLFEAAIGVRFEMRGKHIGSHWHEWIQGVGLYGLGKDLPRIGAGTGSFYDPACEALIVHVWFERSPELPASDLSIRVGTQEYRLGAT